MNKALRRNVNRLKRFLKDILVHILIHCFPGIVTAIISKSKLSHKEESFLAHALEYSRDPVATLNYVSDVVKSPNSSLWRALVRLNKDASISFNTILRDRTSVSSSELRFKLHLNDAVLRQGLIELHSLQCLQDEYADVCQIAEEPKVLRSMFVSLVIARAPVESIAGVLIDLGVDAVLMTEFQKIKLLSRFEQASDRSGFDYWSHRLDPTLSEAGRNKAALMRACLHRKGLQSFLDLEAQFLTLPFQVSRKYLHQVKPLYDRIPVHKNFLAARFDRSSIDTLQRLILRHLAVGKAFSFIRLGDGECYGFPDNEDVDAEGKRRQELHWWGEVLEESLRERLQESFRTAIGHSDILGIPTAMRLIRDFNLSKRDEYERNSLVSRIFCTMKASVPYSERKLVVEDQSNLYLFDDKFVSDIFQNAAKVCVVSGVSSQLVEAWAPDRNKLECIELPTHRLLRNGDVGSSVEGILPHVYERYMEEISSRAEPGVAFLVSAGFIGKIFIAEAASRGAVALDIGQSLVAAVSSRRTEA